MSVQMTVRLPDDLAAFVDRLVTEGVTSSRATAIVTALRHEQRRLTARRDAEIYAAAAPDTDYDRLAAYTAALPTGLP